MRKATTEGMWSQVAGGRRISAVPVECWHTQTGIVRSVIYRNDMFQLAVILNTCTSSSFCSPSPASFLLSFAFSAIQQSWLLGSLLSLPCLPMPSIPCSRSSLSISFCSSGSRIAASRAFQALSGLVLQICGWQDQYPVGERIWTSMKSTCNMVLSSSPAIMALVLISARRACPRGSEYPLDQ